MPCTKRNARAKDIREYLKTLPNDWIFISRKEKNTSAKIIERKTGKVLCERPSNYLLLDWLSEPNNQKAKPTAGFNLAVPVIDIKSETENIAVYIINQLEPYGNMDIRLKKLFLIPKGNRLE